MGKLQSAFEKQDVMRKTSFFGKVFSSPLIRGFYKEEKPVVDIKLEGNKYERLRMTSIINTIANNSPTGREILEAAAKDGYVFGFENQLGSYGFCDLDEKRVCLNPVTNDAKLTATLAHETRHAQQHANGVPKFHTFDLASELKLRRAMEADAQAAALQTVLEIRAATKDEKEFKAFEKTDRYIAHSVKNPSVYLDSVVANRDRNMRDAFKSWFYNRRIVDAYEQGYFYNHLINTDKHRSPEEQASFFAEYRFEGHKTSADILKMVCTTGKGGCYFANDLNVMDQEEMCGLCEDTRVAADEFFLKRKEVTGKAPDTSYKYLPSRGASLRMRMAVYKFGEIKAPKASNAADKKALPPSLTAGLNKLRCER